MYNIPVRDAGDGRRRADIGSAVNGKAINAKTASFALQLTQVGEGFSNAGAAGSITYTLPKPTYGAWFAFYVQAAQALVIVPNASEKVNGGSTSIAVDTTQNGKGFLKLQSDGINWFVSGIGGVWTTS